MKKIVVVLFFLLFLCSTVYASVTEGTINLLKLKTDHFEIIYRQESMATASLVYNNCEQIYSEVCSVLESDPDLFLPVVITDKRYQLNAYYSQFPYNRIVLYDTLSQVDCLTNYKESILGIFRHELVHAVHFNTKGPFWKFLSHLIPGISPQNLYSTPDISEGTAVMIESLDGGGRLNDKSYIQKILQAKAENKFPSQLQAAGARDIYPTGIQYLYGGEFIDWLRKTYSQGQINSFLEQNGRLRFATTYGNFRNSFGETLGNAWSSFTDSFIVPDLTEPNHISGKKSLFSILTKTGDRILCYDSACDELFSINDNNSFEHILYQSTFYPEIGSAPDGSIIIPMVSQKERRLIVTDGIKTKHVFDNARAGVSVHKDGATLITVFCEHQRHSIIETYSPDYEKCASFNLGYGVSVSGFCSLEDGRCAFIASEKGQCSIVIFDPFKQECIYFSIPGIKIIRSLTSHKNTICFSYADTFSCLGMAEIKGDTASVLLSHVLFNGGIKYPVLTNKGSIVFISDYSEYSMLSEAQLCDFDMSESLAIKGQSYSPAEEPDSIAIQSEKYNPLKYFGYFSLLPIAISPEYTFTSDVGFGLTYITHDPTETWNLSASSGYNPKEKHGFSFLTVSNKRKNIPFSLGFHITYPDFSYDFSFATAWTKILRSSGEYVKLSDNASYIRDSKSIRTFNNTLSAGYSYIRNTGIKATDYAGFEAQASFIYNQKKKDGLLGTGFKVSSRIHIPRLLLPHSYITACVQAATKSRFMVSGEFTTIPLCIEIQNGFLDIYFNRFVLAADYLCEYTPSATEFKHTVASIAYLTLSPKIGSLTGSKADLGVKVAYTIGNNTVTVGPYVVFTI